jgi:hypothetical protein
VLRKEAILAAVLVAVILASCSLNPNEELVAGDVVGEWVNVGPQGDNVQLILARDETFQIVGLPSRVLGPSTAEPSLDWNDLIDIHGTWTIEQTGADPQPVVALKIDASEDTSIARQTLHTEGDGEDLELFIFVSASDDNRFTFSRKDP